MGGSVGEKLENIGRETFRASPGGAVLYNAYRVMIKEPREEAINAQREANRQAEAVAAREAGTAPQATNQNDNISDIAKRKAAMRRAIYTDSTSKSKKLGD